MPMGSATYCFSTSGSGRFHRCVSASASAFTRTSLYFQALPTGGGPLASSLQGLPASGRSAHQGLPHMVPIQPDCWRSMSFQVMGWLCGSMKSGVGCT